MAAYEAARQRLERLKALELVQSNGDGLWRGIPQTYSAVSVSSEGKPKP